MGPFLIDRGYGEGEIGKFTATVTIGGMILGSLLAGKLAGGAQGSRPVALGLLLNVVAIGLLATADFVTDGQQGLHLFVLLAIISVTIGWFTVALYQWLMNLTSPKLAATQFTAFMAATNVCEAWSTALFGELESRGGYPLAIGVMCVCSAISMLLLVFQSPRKLSL